MAVLLYKAFNYLPSLITFNNAVIVPFKLIDLFTRKDLLIIEDV